MEIIINQVLILAILATIGALAYRFQVLTDAGRQAIAMILVNITLPLLILSSILKITLTVAIIKNSILVLVFSYCSLGILFVFGRLAARIQRLPKYQANVHTVCTLFGNIVFIGYPLFNVLYPGGEGVLYAALYHLASDTLLWTYGAITLRDEMNGSGTQMKHIVFKKLLNPNFIAFALALVLLSIGFKLPHVFDFSFSGLGGTTLYLAMIYIGAMLAKNKLTNKALWKESLILTVNKMLVIPILFLLFINMVEYVLNIQVSIPVKTVLVIQTAMPCMAIIAILVKEEGVAQVTAHIFTNTIFCMASLPLMFYLIKCLT